MKHIRVNQGAVKVDNDRWKNFCTPKRDGASIKGGYGDNRNRRLACAKEALKGQDYSLPISDLPRLVSP
jgi:hypothetical protein